MKSSLAKIYSALADLKNTLFEKGILDQVQISAPVISVGNLTVGGTGKTPFVDLIMSYLESKALVVNLISRNYRAESSGIHQVNPSRQDAGFFFGDEPTLLAKKHPLSRVFIGPRKAQTLKLAHLQLPASVYVVDDGFQHRDLARDLDFVLVDATEAVENYECLPLGMAREAWSGLSRAHAVILTKTEQVHLDQVSSLTARVRQVFSGPVFLTKSELSFPSEVDPQTARILAVCGIAKPQSFEKAVRDKFQNVQFQTYPDHYTYSQTDFEELDALSKKFDLILTTEKDFVKLSSFFFQVPVQTVKLQTRFVAGENDFYALLDSVLR